MDGLSIAGGGGGSLRPRHEAVAAQHPSQQALILFRCLLAQLTHGN